MRTLVRLAAAAIVVTMLGMSALPALLTGAVTARLQQVAALAAQWDIPPQLVPVFQEAGRTGGAPWALLAGVASVATDFGRHGPDGLARGDTLGTAIYPSVVPPLPGGMFQVDPALPDVRAAAARLAEEVAALAGNRAPQLSQPAATRFWTSIVASLPLRITTIASQGVDATPGPAPAPGDNPIRVFGSLVLPRLGAPVTAANLDAMDAWAAGEGSCAAFNPLDTTQPGPGATPFNTLPGGGHVWNYPSLDAGVGATVETLLNGLYQPVVAALQTSSGVAAVAAAVRRSPWGTGVFGSPSYAGRRCGGSPGPGTAPALGSIQLPTVAGPDAIPATIVARAVTYQAIWDQTAGASGLQP